MRPQGLRNEFSEAHAERGRPVGDRRDPQVGSGSIEDDQARDDIGIPIHHTRRNRALPPG